MAMAPDQAAMRTKFMGKPVLAERRDVLTPYSRLWRPPVSAHDSMAAYPWGRGMFATMNLRVKGT